MEPEENITKTATKMTTLADGNKGTNDNDGSTTDG
jgi:hypothetical protein